MSVYRITKEKFEELEPTSFEAQRIYERRVQSLLREQPDVIEEDLFILAEEYNDWEGSGRRIDLLALDKDGRLVVVELKRSDQQSMMDLQAIRYAAMVANITWDQLVAAHRDYLLRQGQPDEGTDSKIRDHLELENPEVQVNTKNPRIVLVSADFSKELTHSVLWLNERDLDITCIRLQPYKSGDEIFLERSQVIPPPEAKDFQIRLRDMQREAERRGASAVISHTGDDALAAFRNAIENLDSVDQKGMLERVCDMAENLEGEGLTSLRTNVGPANVVLRLELPNWNRALVYGYRKGRVGFLRLIGSYFDSHAPVAKEQIEEIIGESLGRSYVLRNLPVGLLDCLVDAYQEAKEHSTGG